MTEKDPFYQEVESMKDSPVFEQELDEYEEDGDLDHLLEQVESEEPMDVHVERDEWHMSVEEEKMYAFLQEKKKKQDQILQTFTSLENKPSDAEMAQWKTRFGDIYLVSLGPKENFIIRPLKRLEWQQLFAAISKFPEHKKANAIVMKATVWPKLTESAVSVLTAGSVDTLQSLIFEASNFLPPERAIQLVRPL